MMATISHYALVRPVGGEPSLIAFPIRESLWMPLALDPITAPETEQIWRARAEPALGDYGIWLVPRYVVATSPERSNIELNGTPYVLLDGGGLLPNVERD